MTDDDDGRTLLALVDGLGHGTAAAEAADAAIDFVHAPATNWDDLDIPRLMSDLSRALHRTRGAVASIVVIEPRRDLLHFAGVGNVEGYVLGPQPARLVPRFGMLGSGKASIPPRQTMAFPPGATVILHTDGIAGITLAQLPHFQSCVAIAEFMVKRWGRTDDDASAVVARRDDGQQAF